MSFYKIGTCSYCGEQNQILRPSPFMADREAMMCEYCWNETQKEYAASNGEYIPDFDSRKEEYIVSISEARNRAVNDIFKKVSGVIDELLEISNEYASWDEWDKADIVSNAKNILSKGFEKELISNMD